MTWLLTHGIALLCTLIFIPLVMIISKQFEIVDLPNQRKVHVNYISRLGGVAIFSSILFSFFLSYHFGLVNFASKTWSVLLIGGTLAFLLGVWDDLKNVPAKQKLVLQLVLGVCAFKLGFRIEAIQIDLGRPIHLGVFSLPITVLWIATIMNAFNMIDGLDGLAGGVAFLVFSTLSVLGFLNENPIVMVLSLICAGSCLGFLVFNFHPARIFMGDSGSMTLGYLLSILSVSAGQNAHVTSIFTPLFLLAFPLVDLITAIVRRIILAKTKNKNISYFSLLKKTFDADGNHVHHRLLKLGFSQKKIAMLIYAFTALSCALGVVSIYFSFGLIFFLFIFYVWFTVQCVRLLDYEEFVTSTFRDQKRQFEEKQKLSTAPSLIKKVI